MTLRSVSSSTLRNFPRLDHNHQFRRIIPIPPYKFYFLLFSEVQTWQPDSSIAVCRTVLITAVRFVRAKTQLDRLLPVTQLLSEVYRLEQNLVQILIVDNTILRTLYRESCFIFLRLLMLLSAAIIPTPQLVLNLSLPCLCLVLTFSSPCVCLVILSSP